MTTRKLIWVAPILMLLLAVPATVASAANTRGHWGENQIFRFDLGYFETDGDSEYWDDRLKDFTGTASDFEDVAIGVEWVKFLGDRLGFAVSVSGYEGGSTEEYRDYEDQFGGAIFHTAELELTSLTLGLFVHLTQRDRAIVPYIGLGGGVWEWRLTEVGDFIDFKTEDLEVFSAFFRDEGDTLGYYWRFGFEVPVAQNWSAYAESRWQRVEDDLGGDFRGLGEIDLSGQTISAGISVSF